MRSQTEHPTRQILVATDFLDSAEAALAVAAAYARALHAGLHVFHVFSRDEVEVTRLLSEAASRAGSEVNVTVGGAGGDPAEEILRYAGRHPIELIVVGTHLMRECDIRHLPVLDGGKVVGILSERDIVKVVAREGAAALDIPVRSAMTLKVNICNENHTVNEVMEIMTRGRFRHLPVEKNGLLDGIVSIGDVVKAQRDQYQGEVATLQFQLLNEPDTTVPRAS